MWGVMCIHEICKCIYVLHINSNNVINQHSRNERSIKISRCKIVKIL